MVKILSLNNSTDFDGVVDLIHDEWFHLDEVVFDAANHTAHIPFIKEIFDEHTVLSGTLIKKISIPVVQCYLQIFEVLDCTIVDTVRVGSYDMVGLLYEPDSRALQLTTGVPLEFKMVVDQINIEISSDEVPLDHKTMRILGV